MASGAGSIGRFELRTLRIEACLGIAALAGLVSVPVLHTPAALLFLASGTLLALWRPRATVATVLDAKALFLLPVFCLMSVVWSLYPALTFRHSLQLSATFVIAVLIAHRVPFRSSLFAVFLSLFLWVLFSIFAGSYRSDTGALVGLYGSKNEMAGMSALLALTGFGIATVRDISPAARLLGMLGFLTGSGAIVLAQSVGAMGYLPSAVLAVLSVMLVKRARVSVRATVAILCALLLLAVSIAVAAKSDAVARIFFDLTGKDFTLTGRVELWEVALNLVAERPILGTGYQAFWVQGHPPAEALWEAFGIESRSGFNFHNTYLSNAVEIGLAGLAIEIALIASALVLSGRLALRTGSREADVLFGLAVFMTVTTVFEAPVFFQFSLQSVLYVLVIVYASRGLRRLTHR